MKLERSLEGNHKLKTHYSNVIPFKNLRDSSEKIGDIVKKFSTVTSVQ